MSMATRAIADSVAGRRSGLAAVLSLCRRGGARGLSHSSTAQRRQEDHHHQGVAGDGHEAAAAQVEASQNRKNVEVVQGDDRSATLPAGEPADDAAWVPDQETGVFVPAEEAAANGNGGGGDKQPAGPAPSVLDQAVFVRDEDMEDVERPAVDMSTRAAGGGGGK
ncbi:unnamed protein product [Urochloa humidicola]